MDKVKVFEKELEWIGNEKIKEFAKTMIEGLPDYFFEVAASSTGKYHPPYALGSGGLIRHTKAALMIAKELLALEMFTKKFTDDDKDLIYTALIAHDGKKHGNDFSKYVIVEHPLVAAEYVKEVQDRTKTLTDEQIDKLYEMIASHMGQWNTDRYKNEILPKPKTSMQSFVHLCDYLASRKFLLVDFGDDVYEPEKY